MTPEGEAREAMSTMGRKAVPAQRGHTRVATAGFTLMTESLHLNKPFMALPMKGQFEQELNGLLLADLAYGKNCRRTTAEAIGDFLYRIPDYRGKLGKYPRRDNAGILQKLEELLADNCALARRYHRRA